MSSSLYSAVAVQAGMARFPGTPAVLILYADHIIHVKKEPRAARTQLQVASKNDPGFIDRYNIFSAMVGYTHMLLTSYFPAPPARQWDVRAPDLTA